MTSHRDFLENQSRSGDTVVAAVADNCRFDERAGVPRWQQFDSLLSNLAADPFAIDWSDWAATDRAHRERYCEVASPLVPDALHAINRLAWLEGLSPNQSVIRIETLTRALRSPLDVGSLRGLLHRADSGDNDAHRAVSSFFEQWNQRRDARPAFAAFYDEVREESDSDDWPHLLRDRLGLGHYGHAGRAPLPVALMRYSLADVFEVQNQRRLPAACAVPTVLDGGMHEFFFPVPREHPYGATLHLVPSQGGDLTAEILHCRIEYRREHLWQLGWITRPHRMTVAELRRARDAHLLELQVECNREDFGEALEGRA